MFYMNMDTGEIINDQKQATKWYSDGVNVGLYHFSETFKKWVMRLEWFH